MFDTFNGIRQFSYSKGSKTVVTSRKIYMKGCCMKGSPFVFVVLETVVSLFLLGRAVHVSAPENQKEQYAVTCPQFIYSGAFQRLDNSRLKYYYFRLIFSIL